MLLDSFHNLAGDQKIGKLDEAMTLRREGKL